jgi:hypothetical protein
MEFVMKLTIACAAAGMAFLSTNARAAEPNFYQFFCKPGGDMTITVVSSRQRAQTGLLIRFARAPDGASKRTLLPGECAWGDRGVSGDEPHELYWRLEGVAIDVAFDSRRRLANWSVGNLSRSGSSGFLTTPSTYGMRADIPDRFLNEFFAEQDFRVWAYAADSSEIGRRVLVLRNWID